MNPLFILFAIPFFFLLIGIEMLIGWFKHKKLYRFNDAITNLNLGVGNQIFNLFFKAAIAASLIWVQQNWGAFEIPITWWSVGLCLVLFDFLYYWAHRWGHTMNIFWGAHLVHHQSEEYNLSVALRQSWFHNLLAFFIFLPIPLFGFKPEVFLAVAGFDTLYQFGIHTKLVKKFPRWIEFIFNTPSHHRVHHGINPKYLDKNHAGVFIVWDRLFGTFMEEEEEPTYGITTQFKSWNPVWANIHHYVEMVRESTDWKFTDRIKMFFMKPGWRPEEFGGQQFAPEVDPSREKFDKKTNRWLNAYILGQFVAIILGTLAFMTHFEDISTFYKVAFLSILSLSLMLCGAIFENKNWAIVAEYVRLILIVASLNTFYYFWYLDWFVVMIIFSGIGFIAFNVWFTVSWRWLSGIRLIKVQ